MPEVEDYLQGFNMHIGNMYGLYKVTNLNVAHHSEVRFTKYSYPIDITLENKANPSMEEANKAIRELSAAVSGVRIIYTPAGRPYECTFFWGTTGQITQENNYSTIHFISTGYAIRVSKAEITQIQTNGQWVNK